MSNEGVDHVYTNGENKKYYFPGATLSNTQQNINTKFLLIMKIYHIA